MLSGWTLIIIQAALIYFIVISLYVLLCLMRDQWGVRQIKQAISREQSELNNLDAEQAQLWEQYQNRQAGKAWLAEELIRINERDMHREVRRILHEKKRNHGNDD